MTLAATDVSALREELAAERQMNDLLVEEATAAELELAAENKGWRVAGLKLEQEFSRSGLTAVIENCRIMGVASPLIKRGLQLRGGYVFGQRVSVSARSGADAEQDVNAVVQAFWDDPSNQASFTSAQALETNERSLGTDGNLILAFFTDPRSGRTQVRVTPFEEIQDKLTNPEDRDDTWFFYRQYQAVVLEQGYNGLTRSRRETRRVLHPALGFWPAQRPTSIDGIPVVWDQPMLHVTVNRPQHWKWGVPDVYASLPWATAYEGFLTDWARLVKALSKFAWRLTGDRGSKVQRAAEKARAAFPQVPGVNLPGGTDGPVGATAAMGPNVNLEAIPKSGATIDSGSGKPLAAMVAAGLGLPVTALLADPGVTGARAVAETLDKPTVLEMTGRQQLWADVIQTVLGYVVDQAAKAPDGPLQAGPPSTDVFGRPVTPLAGGEDDAGVDKTVVVEFPDINDLDVTALVNAIVAADGTGKMPPLEVARLLLTALGVDDVDELLEDMTDEEGNWIDPEASAGDVAAEAHRRGEDPAAAVYGA